ncbi:MAG: hypothetical protein ACYC67_21435 [Prosthecobacter sp.]|jgi:hypothetical protein
MSMKALLSAVGFVLLVGAFAFSLWAEWGPYAWVAAAQLAVMDSYSEKLTFILTFLLFLIPALVLLFQFFSGGRLAQAVGLGVPVVLILIHLAATVFFVSSGGSQLEAATFESGIRTANFVPQNITLERRLLPDLMLDQASGVKSGSSSDDSADLYIPFAASSWPSPETMVVLKSTPAHLEKLAEAENLEGVLRKMPLPYLVRSSWPQNPSIFAIVIEDRTSVRGLWIPAAAVYVLFLIWGAVSFFKSRRARSAQQAAQI